MTNYELTKDTLTMKERIKKGLRKKGRDDKSKEREENMKTKCFLFPSFSDRSKNNRLGRKANGEERDHI